MVPSTWSRIIIGTPSQETENRPGLSGTEGNPSSATRSRTLSGINNGCRVAIRYSVSPNSPIGCVVYGFSTSPSTTAKANVASSASASQNMT